MEFTKEQRESLKKMMLFLVQKKDKESGGHCGYHPVELLELFEELVTDGQIRGRDTLHTKRYFLVKNDLTKNDH